MKNVFCSKVLFIAVAFIAFVFVSASTYSTASAAPRPAAVPAKAAAGASGYHLLKTIPIPGDEFWDYMGFDRSTGRLFITHGNHVVVVDVKTDKIVGTIGPMEGIHGVVFAPEYNRGFVTDGRAAKLWFFDLKTLQIEGSAPTDKDADGVVYDPASKRVFTMNGDSQTSTVVDAKTGKVAGKIELGGGPEFPVADGRGHVYANIETTSEIVEIDSHTMKITHRWPLAPGEHPSGLSIDAKHHLLFSGCHNQMMVIMNADTGKVVATEPIGRGVDATRFDAGTGYAFSSNGADANLTVIHEDSPTKFRVVEDVHTELGARTMALNPFNHDVYLVTAKLERITNPPPHTRPFKMVPGSFHLLIFGR